MNTCKQYTTMPDRIAHHWSTLSANEKGKYSSVTSEPRCGNRNNESLLNAGSRHADVGVEPGLDETESLPGSEIRHRNVISEPNHYVAEVKSMISTDLRQDTNGKMLSVETSDMHEWISKRHSSKPAILNRYSTPSELCNERLTTSVSNVRRIRHESPVDNSLSHDATKVDVFSWAHEKILSADQNDVDSQANYLIVNSTDNSPLPSLSDYVASYHSDSTLKLKTDRASHHERSFDHKECLESRVISSGIPVVPASSITSISLVGEKTGGTTCTNAQVSINTSSNSGSAHLPQFPNSEDCNSNHYRVTAPDGIKQKQTSSSDETNGLNTIVTNKRKRKQTVHFSCDDIVTKKRLNKCKTFNRQSKKKRRRGRKEVAMYTSKVRHSSPRFFRARSALGTSQERLMTGSMIFSSGITVRYRKILPKPPSVTPTLSTHFNKISIEPTSNNGTNFTEQHATNDVIGQHNLVILPREERMYPVRDNLATLKEGQIIKFKSPKDDVFSSAKGYRLETENIKESQQDQLANLSATEGQGRIREFVHLSHPKDEVFSSVKRYRLETENLKYQLEDRAVTEVNVGSRNIPDTRITRERESSIKEHINKTCVSKESKSTVTLNDIKRSYNVVLNRWTDWETPPIKMNVPSTLRNKSPVPNLVSVFSLVPEVSDRKEDGTIGSSSDDMDLLAGGCDSPMWLSSESSGADSPTCVDDTGLTDNALAGCAEEDRPPDNLKKCREEYVTSVDGEYLSDRLHHQLKTGYRNGPPSDNTNIRNVSNTATNGQGAYLLSDDVIAMRHFYHC